MSMGYRGVVVGALLSGLLLVSSPSPGQAGEPQERVRETVNAVLAVLQDKSLGSGQRHQTPRADAAGGVSAFRL